ncbi:MAG TPA: hypothetical protein VK870_12140 [Ignavibacteriaceae bacterium]|nr:hypothetical protein [Ignavibacteriaceae bacterium]
MNFNKIDNEIASFMQKWGVIALRISLGIIFIWFGVLKTAGISPAEPLVKSTVGWMPFFSTDGWVVIIGWWEVIIGVSFLFQKTIRIAIALLAMQMAGTFMPLIILTEVTFQSGGFPYAPTLEGQYIIKNLLIISAALVIGGTVRKLNE